MLLIIILAFYWKASERLSIRTDLEYDHRKTSEQVRVTLPTAVNRKIMLPVTVDPTKSVGPDAKFETDAVNALLRADYSLDDKWVLSFEGVHAQTSRDRNLATFRFTNAASVATGAGRIQGISQHALVKSNLVKGELYGNLEVLGQRHELTLGASSTDKSQDPLYNTSYTVAAQNLYTPVSIDSVVWGARPSSPTTAGLNTTDTGIESGAGRGPAAILGRGRPGGDPAAGRGCCPQTLFDRLHPARWQPATDRAPSSACRRDRSGLGPSDGRLSAWGGACT